MNYFQIAIVVFASIFVLVIPLIVGVVFIRLRVLNRQATDKKPDYSAGSMCEDGDSHSSHSGTVQHRAYACPYSDDTRPRCRDCTDIMCDKSPFYQG